MPSSRIIKGNHRAPEPMQRFHFGAIEKTSDSSRGEAKNPNGSVAPSPEDPPPPDPEKVLRELEDTVRSRLLEAERKAQEMERSAYERGYAQGQKDGFEYGEKSATLVKERLEHILGQIASLPRTVLNDYRDWLVSTCLTLSRKIVGREISLNPEALLQLAEELIDEADSHYNLTLYLNQKDLELFSKHAGLDAWKARFQGSLAIKSDASLERGGCRLESDSQVFDASLETRFLLLEEALRTQADDGETAAP